MKDDDAMSHDACSCADYQDLARSRRAFLRTAAGASVGALAATMFGSTFRQVAYGATVDTDVVVVLSLRGGADSLSMVVPHGDPAYYTARPGIAVPQASLLARDGMFGLHPALRPVLGLWTAGRMAAVVATGLPAPNRSHFAAMEEVEDADPASPARRGWVNRLAGLDQERAATEAVHLGDAMVPAALWGPAPVLAAAKVDHLQIPGAADAERLRRKRRALGQVWSSVGGPLGAGARSTLATTARLRPVASRDYRPANGARYPRGGLGAALEDTARLLKAGVGVEVVTVDHGSWDMHNHVGQVGSTHPLGMQAMLSELARAVAALFTDLGGLGSRVTVVTLTEFGRRVAENGNGGLDHGWGAAMLLFGAGVRGGRYHGSWPGLGYDALVDGDLAVTTDYRSVLSEVLRSRFGSSPSRVFPGFAPEHVGVMR